MPSRTWLARDLPDKNFVTGIKSDDPFEESFRFVLPGYNVRPSEMSGAIGIEQLKKLPGFIKNRRDNGQYFQELFIRHSAFTIQREVGHSSWFGFALIIRKESGIQRKDLVARLVKQALNVVPLRRGILLKTHVVDCFDYTIHGALDNAQYIEENGFLIGNHHRDIKDNLSAFHKVVSQVF